MPAPLGKGGRLDPLAHLHSIPPRLTSPRYAVIFSVSPGVRPENQNRRRHFAGG